MLRDAMRGKLTDRTGLVDRLKHVLSHMSRGFSFIIAPHGTGTTVSFNLSGKVAMVILVLVVVFVAGLAFVGVTYTKLAVLALQTDRLKAENQVLRGENQRINEIEMELARLDELRREIQAWAGVLPEQAEATEPEYTPALLTSVWPRRYTYAIMKPLYLAQAAYPHGMIRPASGWISRGFIPEGGERGGHPGIDIAAATGTPVRAALEGVVMSAGWDDVYGNVIIIEHSDSLTTIYGHNEKIRVKEGAYVTKGQIIASVGSTGRSTAPHLHFEVLINDKPVDPKVYVDFTTD
jgi:murein DD-endopeptidase MepM/ murein hydrolase activator NlpD